MIDPQKWLIDEYPEEIATTDLRSDCAKSIVRLAGSDDYNAVIYQTARKSKSDREAIVLEIEVALEQRAIENDIRTRETIVIICLGDALPTVRTMRMDFPDVPHLNMGDSPTPRSLCLYDEPESEVMLSWTALSFIERIRWWFEKSAYGNLHGEAQPLDPILYNGAALTIFASKSVMEAEVTDAIVLDLLDTDEIGPTVIRMDIADASNSSTQSQLAGVIVRTEPREHGRLRYAPGDLNDLTEFDEEFQFGIIDTLESTLLRWVAENPDLLSKQLVLLLVIPIEREAGKGIEAVSTKALWTAGPAGLVGEELGLLGAVPDGGSWVRLISREPYRNLNDIHLVMADVRYEFSPEMAAAASGVDVRPTKYLQIGVGSLGAQVSLALAQQGRGRWTFVDGDRLFPHNLARHPLPYVFLGQHKASSLAIYVNNLVNDNCFAKSIECDVLHPQQENDDLTSALMECQVILDTSASIPVARFLSIDVETESPIMSVFFNPAGTDLMILWEGSNKKVRLDDCEMAYYFALLSESATFGHLSLPLGDVVHGTACREPSTQMPQSKVMRLAGMAADSVRAMEAQSSPLIQMWRDSDEGLIKRYEASPSAFLSAVVQDWKIRCNASAIERLQNLRAVAGKIETGGVLFGSWDRRRKIVYVVGITGPPPDSFHSETGFVRGTVGLRATIAKISTTTLNNLCYVGEWHSHPQHHPATLSSDDRAFLQEMKQRTLLEDSPAIMMVAGEDGVRCAVMHPCDEKEVSVMFI